MPRPFRLFPLIGLAASVAGLSGCRNGVSSGGPPPTPAQRKLLSALPASVQGMMTDVHRQTRTTREYDPAYVQLSYPGGDVPAHTGVCTDVVVRAHRAAGLDLQRVVHEDMRAHFSAYPRRYGLSRPDRNIDHRRVPNLMTYFRRQGRSLGTSTEASLYRPGDVVAWKLSNGALHTGMVSDVPSERGWGWKVVHNIGGGARVEDVLFDMEVVGHYRYFR